MADLDGIPACSSNKQLSKSTFLRQSRDARQFKIDISSPAYIQEIRFAEVKQAAVVKPQGWRSRRLFEGHQSRDSSTFADGLESANLAFTSVRDDSWEIEL